MSWPALLALVAVYVAALVIGYMIGWRSCRRRYRGRRLYRKRRIRYR